jgi:hypothetical protein
MNGLNVVIRNRDFTSRMGRNDLKYQVNSYGFGVVGGPKEASLTLEGGELALWEAINLLRCPVEIVDGQTGVTVWWGYVDEARVRQGALEVMVSMASVVNRCEVVYSYVAAGSQTVGERRTTDQANDLDSQAELGIKEWLASGTGMSTAVAEAKRDAIIAGQRWPQGGATTQFGNPRGRVRYSGAKRSLSATLLCKGWWATLDWRHFWNSGTGLVDTTDQIKAVITAVAPFFTATDIEAASGKTSSEYRDGDQTALAVIEGLLKSGGANGRRLLAWVDVNRRLQIYEEPAIASCDLSMDETGQVFEAGGRRSYEFLPPVGRWVRLQDVIPGTVDLTRLVDPSLQFIEEAEWSSIQGDAAGDVKYTFKGKPSLEDLLAVG